MNLLNSKKPIHKKLNKDMESKVCVICNTEKVLTHCTKILENVNSEILKKVQNVTET